MPEIKDFVSRTSLFIAGIRAIETEKDDRFSKRPLPREVSDIARHFFVIAIKN
jgi:hypothetical protein